jgi:predicted MPP superfamily phosphohydrolase
MSRFLVGISIAFVLIGLTEWYSFQAIKTIFREKWMRQIWVVVHLVIYGFAIFKMFNLPSGGGQTKEGQMVMGIIITMLIPKFVIIFTLLGEDIFRFIKKWIVSAFSSESVSYDSRRKFISQMALGLAAIPFAGFIYGIIKGKYNYKVIKYSLEFPDLPASFDGMTITHISDIHSGSFDNREKIAYGVDLINEQKSDLILFTGDIVNNKAEEMDPWKDLFSSLEAKEGKFSVLGNHDYGDYVQWESPKDKEDNFNKIQNIHQEIGFNLLMDENHKITRGEDSISLVGVQNWGKGFHKVGDLKKATESLNRDDFKVLLSHDPSHWEEEVKSSDIHYQLTLSGHTHGLQFGIEIPGWIKWSPSRFAYKYWAGMYEEFGRYLNVNRGFGFHAFPGRVGIWPEITVIELKKKSV